MKRIKDVLTFIKKAHAGQRYGSSPYWTHPLNVAETGKGIFGGKFTDDTYIAALLHDTVEDTFYTLEDLKNLGFSDKVLNAVLLLTKEKSLSYEDNIKQIISSRDKMAMMVKFADNFVNFTGDKSDWNPQKREKSQAKYWKSMQDLGKVLGVDPEKLLENNK